MGIMVVCSQKEKEWGVSLGACIVKAGFIRDVWFLNSLLIKEGSFGEEEAARWSREGQSSASGPPAGIDQSVAQRPLS
jgi:hypothetical protein